MPAFYSSRDSLQICRVPFKANSVTFASSNAYQAQAHFSHISTDHIPTGGLTQKHKDEMPEHDVVESTGAANAAAGRDDPYAPWQYQEELPQVIEGSPLASGLKLLETYSGIPAAEVPGHVKAIVSSTIHTYLS